MSLALSGHFIADSLSNRLVVQSRSADMRYGLPIAVSLQSTAGISIGSVRRTSFNRKIKTL
jgi:hypothetical protein